MTLTALPEFETWLTMFEQRNMDLGDLPRSRCAFPTRPGRVELALTEIAKQIGSIDDLLDANQHGGRS